MVQGPTPESDQAANRVSGGPLFTGWVVARRWRKSSVQLEVTGYRIDELVIVGADGQAGPGGHASEFGQAAVGDQVD